MHAFFVDQGPQIQEQLQNHVFVLNPFISSVSIASLVVCED